MSAKQPDGLNGPLMYDFVKQVKGKGCQLHGSLYQNCFTWHFGIVGNFFIPLTQTVQTKLIML